MFAVQILAFWMEKNRKYKMQEEFDAKALKAFAQGVADGTAYVSEHRARPRSSACAEPRWLDAATGTFVLH